MHTHLAHYEGELAVRMALGEDVRPDFSAIPRSTYTMLRRQASDYFLLTR